MNGRDTIDLVEYMVKRAAGLHHLETVSGSSNEDAPAPDFRALRADNPEDVAGKLVALAAYSYPDTISLPADYVPPAMAIASCYWKVKKCMRNVCAKS